MLKKTLVPVALCCAALWASPGIATGLCVKVSQANLRAGPGTDHQKSWEVYLYMPFKKVGQDGSWIQVKDMDGDIHWVHDQLVTDEMRCAVVKVNQANVRTGPGTHYAKSTLSPVEKNYPFKVIETQDGWVKVQDEVANEGWVAQPLLWMP
jgi:SH3-like domain-containing protein